MRTRSPGLPLLSLEAFRDGWLWLAVPPSIDIGELVPLLRSYRVLPPLSV